MFLTLKAYRATPFITSELNQCVIGFLTEMRLEYGCWVGAYCLMPDHLHLVSGPRSEERSVLTFVDRFKGRTTNASWNMGWAGKLWQKRGHDHLIRQAEDLDDISRYILENPVRAGLCENAADWPWSGILDTQDDLR